MKRFPMTLLALAACAVGAVPTVALAQDAAPKPDAPAPAAATPATAEKVAPGLVLDALWDGRKIVPFKALDYPKMVKAADAAEVLDDSEYVLGVTVNGESRAYPTRFTWFHHVINDKIGDTEFAVTYCSVCNTGIAYDRKLDGKPVLLDFYGLYNGVVVLAERETQTVFLHVTGEFVKGPLTGKSLTTIPMLDTTWGQWKKLHPDSQVMAPSDAYKRYYQPKGGRAEPRGYDQFPLPFFQTSLSRTDKRLPKFDKVVGVAIPTKTANGTEGLPARRAYPIAALTEAKGVIQEAVEGQDVVVWMEPESVTVGAFLRTLDGKTLNFETRAGADGKTAPFDKETGSRWNVEGLAEDGPLKGKSLTRLENHLSQWYGWAAYFPETTVYGRTDPPQTEILKKN